MEKRLSQKKLSDLRKFQVHKLFVIYLNEQLSLEHLFNYSEDSESYYERRKNILLDFRQKMRELERKNCLKVAMKRTLTLNWMRYSIVKRI